MATEHKSPARVWRLPIDQPHRLGRRAGNFCFVGGAADLGAAGKIEHPGDLRSQIPGVIENVRSTLRAQACALTDVVRLKVFFRPGQHEGTGWDVLADIRGYFPETPAPVISMQPVVMMPWDGAELQVQAIAVKGWRSQEPIRFVTEQLRAPHQDAGDVTLGLLGGGFFAVSDMPGHGGGQEDHPPAETDVVMNRLESILAGLDVSWNDAIKLEGYYFGTRIEDWEPLAKERARRFTAPGPGGTVVPWHVSWPGDVTTKVELLGYRSQLNGRSKPVARGDSWPDWVWDWPIPVPYRQGLSVNECIWLGGQIPQGGGERGDLQFPGDLDRQIDFTMAHINDILFGFERRVEDLALMVCYFESDGSADSSLRVLERLAMNVPGQLPPVTLVPQPSLHFSETKIEIWGVACG